MSNALRILSLLAEEGELGVSQLAKRIGVNKSVVYRILSTLKQERFAAQDPVSRKYRVGPMACAVGQAFLARNNIYSATVSCLEEDLRQYTAYVGYLDGYETITVAVREGSGTVTVRATGSRAYVHTTAIGKAIAAHLPADEIERRFSGWSFPKVTPHTIDSYERFLRELEIVRVKGFATAVQELELGVASIGAPIWGPSGVVAGLSIAYPVGTVTPEQECRLAELVVDSAAKASSRLGGFLCTHPIVRGPQGKHGKNDART